MSDAQNNSIKSRIEKDIVKFHQNLSAVGRNDADIKTMKVIELSEMYASDAKSYLDKSDYYTAFSCISYAHGLLDAIIQTKQ